jgi:hypothetical protein
VVRSLEVAADRLMRASNVVTKIYKGETRAVSVLD